MATEIKIPIPDQTTEEVRVVKWHKAQGDKVAKGDIVLEVETDKSVIEVEAAGDGVLLKQLNAEDDMVPVGNVVGFIGAPGEKIDTPDSASSETAVADTTVGSTAAAAEPGQLPDGAVEVKIPIPDQTTEEVRVVKWLKAQGDKVAKGDVVLEVETDKSVIEVEATGDGTLLKQLNAEDDMVPVGNVVGVIGKAGMKIDIATAPAAKPATASAPKAATAPAVPVASAASVSNARVKASPVAKKLAAKLGVDITCVKGTGPNGRIVQDDVQRFADSGNAPTPIAPAAAVSQEVLATIIDGRVIASPNAKRIAKQLGVDLTYVKGTGPNGRIVAADVQKAATAGTAASTGVTVGTVSTTASPLSLEPVEGQPTPGSEVELTKMRRAIGKNLQTSSRDTPHFNVTISINMTRANEFRNQFNAGLDKGNRLSVNDLIVKACAVALKQYPAVNCRLGESSISYLPEINIGIAIAIPDGLIVPVLTNADKRSWSELGPETKNLAQTARQGKLIGMGKGTFTISNLGMYGIDEFTAIVNPPEAAILAVGGTKDTVVAIDGMIAIKPMMSVTLCSDHRLVDGALAAQFLKAVKMYIEEQIA